MQLLDAILAFVLTVGALATVVTVIMEACLRMSRMRKKNLVEIMKVLDKELDEKKGTGTLRLSEEERWDFFRRVVESPTEETLEQLKSEWDSTMKTEDLIALFGRDRAAGMGRWERIGTFFRQLLGDKKRAGLQEKVSLEYMLRCLAQTQSVKEASISAKERLEVEFNRIARKFEEAGASVSASFKRHASAWSLGIGIFLALFANIDGVRIFDAYRLNPEQAAAVIESQDKFLNRYEKNLAESQQTAEAENPSEETVSWEELQVRLLDTREDLAFLATQGVPFGWAYYPNCPFGGKRGVWESSGPKCRAIYAANKEEFFPKPENKSPSKAANAGFSGPPANGAGLDSTWLRVAKTALLDPAGFAVWLVTVVLTGILIGLGAPFWFDVAKRLSQIRKGLQSPSASGEYRFAASDAYGDYDKRKKIVKHVLEEASAEASAEAAVKAAREDESEPRAEGEEEDAV